MPLVPHYPSDEPRRNRDAPDFGEIVEEILHGGDDPASMPG
jgi:hypothetical protein